MPAQGAAASAPLEMSDIRTHGLEADNISPFRRNAIARVALPTWGIVLVANANPANISTISPSAPAWSAP